MSLQEWASSPAFAIFAAFVALNTLVYIGLTLSRLIPWPKPIEISLAGDRAKVLEVGDVGGLRQAVQDHLAGKDDVAQVARGLLWLGLVGFGVAGFEVWDGGTRTAELVAVGLGISCLGASLAVRRQRMSATTATWLWALFIAAADSALMVQAGSSGDGFRYSFAIVIMAGFGTLCFAYVPFAVSAGLQVGVLAMCLVIWPTEGALQWMIAALTAVVAGYFMVGQRRAAQRAMSNALAVAETYGLRDTHSAALSLEGLVALGEPLAEVAWSEGRTPHLLFARIDNEDLIARNYGADYVGQLERSITEVLGQMSTPGDLVGKVGPGTLCLVSWRGGSDDDLMRHRLRRRVADLALGKSQVTVDIWTRDAPSSRIETSWAALVMAAAKPPDSGVSGRTIPSQQDAPVREP